MAGASLGKNTFCSADEQLLFLPRQLDVALQLPCTNQHNKTVLLLSDDFCCAAVVRLRLGLGACPQGAAQPPLCHDKPNKLLLLLVIAAAAHLHAPNLGLGAGPQGAA